MARKPIQFNWRRHWSKKVTPLLSDPLVQCALDAGMLKFDPSWESGDPPHSLGRDEPGRRIVRGKLSWHQPIGCCHWIVLFSYAIGIRLRPDLQWDIVTGDLHTVAVGFDQHGDPVLVMDILCFERMSAEESLCFAMYIPPDTPPSDKEEWYRCYVEIFQRVVVALDEGNGNAPHEIPEAKSA